MRRPPIKRTAHRFCEPEAVGYLPRSSLLCSVKGEVGTVAPTAM